jgi:hypothetical protein
MIKMLSSLGLTGVLALGLSACDGHMPMHGMHHGGGAAALLAMSLQGNDTAAFFANPNAHAFYDLSVKTFANGTKDVNFPEYQEKSFAIFRALGTAMGVGPAAMQDHLKLIPAQMMKIVAEDPSVLKDYDSFKVAMVGPA